MTRWQEKNVGVMRRKGSSERTPVIDERDGSVAGERTEHWDDHVDTTARIAPVKVKARRVER